MPVQKNRSCQPSRSKSKVASPLPFAAGNGFCGELPETCVKRIPAASPTSSNQTGSADPPPPSTAAPPVDSAEDLPPACGGDGNRVSPGVGADFVAADKGEAGGEEAGEEGWDGEDAKEEVEEGDRDEEAGDDADDDGEEAGSEGATDGAGPSELPALSAWQPSAPPMPERTISAVRTGQVQRPSPLASRRWSDTVGFQTLCHIAAGPAGSSSQQSTRKPLWLDAGPSSDGFTAAQKRDAGISSSDGSGPRTRTASANFPTNGSRVPSAVRALSISAAWGQLPACAKRYARITFDQ